MNRTEEIRKARRKLVKFGSILLFIGLGYFIFSMSTKSWEPVSANLVSVSSNTIKTADGGPSLKNRLGAGSSYSWPSVNYEYSYSGQKFKGNTVCICIPIGIQVPISQSTNVYVAPYYPSLSVLVHGPHLLLLFIFILLGGCCLASKFLEPYEQA